MNILHLTRHFDHGGITRCIDDLAEGQVARGHNVYVASGGGERVHFLAKKGVQHVRVPQSKLEFGPRLWLALLEMRLLFPRPHFDVLHAHTRSAQVLGSILSNRWGIPLVTTCHGYFGRNLGRRLWPCWGQRTIAISRAVREHLIHAQGVPAQRVALIPNGINPERFRAPGRDVLHRLRDRLGIPAQAPVIGTVARLSPVKGLDFILRTVASLKAQKENVHAVLVGSGPEEQSLRELAGRLHVVANVHFVGTMEDISAYLALMDMAVFPSRREGFGLSILEAMAAGKPVVGSPVGGIPELIQDKKTGLLMQSLSAEALTAQVHRLLGDGRLAQRLAQAGREKALQHTAEKMTADTEKAYASLLPGRLRDQAGPDTSPGMEGQR